MKAGYTFAIVSLALAIAAFMVARRSRDLGASAGWLIVGGVLTLVGVSVAAITFIGI
jgi:uncharacterized membrane protein YhaH (DUF805 family)